MYNNHSLCYFHIPCGMQRCEKQKMSLNKIDSQPVENWINSILLKHQTLWFKSTQMKMKKTTRKYVQIISSHFQLMTAKTHFFHIAWHFLVIRFSWWKFINTVPTQGQLYNCWTTKDHIKRKMGCLPLWFFYLEFLGIHRIMPFYPYILPYFN